MSNIQKNYLSALHKWLNQLEEGNKHPAFASELSIVEKVFKYLRLELDIENPKFLDLGCATGNILYAAKNLLGKDGEYCGVEHNGTYAAAAKSIDYAFKILVIDMFSKIVQDKIKDADVIYTYVPVGGAELVKLYKLISIKAKKGAIIVINDTNMRHEYFSASAKIQPIKRFEGSDCCDKTDILVFRKE